MQTSASAPRIQVKPAIRVASDPAFDGWNELHSLPKPRSLQRAFKPGDNQSRTELSAISDARESGGLQQTRTRLAMPHEKAVRSDPYLGVDHGSASHLPRLHQRGAGNGGRPSNRSEAAFLAREFQRRLDEAPARSFDSQKTLHDEVFKAVTDQVTVHCSERGEVLERLRQFYTKSVDVTARIAEKATRTELTARIRELEGRVAGLEKENERLAERQLRGDPEAVILDLFRDLKPHKKARTMGLLFAEAGHLLMRVGGNENQLQSAAEQAAVMNQLVLSHTEKERAAVLASLLSISPMREQYSLLRRFLRAMPTGDQIKMSMEILAPEQQRRIMLGIFDAAPSDQDKAALLLDMIHTMSASKLPKTLSLVLSAIATGDLLSSMRPTLASKTQEDAAAFVAEVIAMLDPSDGSQSIASWAADLLVQAERAELEVARRAEREAATNFVNTTPAGDGVESDIITLQEVMSTVHDLLQELVRILGYDEARDAFASLIAESDEKVDLLTKLVGDSCVTKEEVSRVVAGVINGDGAVLQTPLVSKTLAKHLSSSTGGARVVAQCYRQLQPSSRRCVCLGELTSKDAFSEDECQMMMMYLVQIASQSVKKFGVALSSGEGIGKQRVVKRREKGDVAELLPVNEISSFVADIIVKKARDDVAAERKQRPRPKMSQLLREYMFRQYGFKKVADAADRNIRHSISHFAESSLPVRSRMRMAAGLVGIDLEGSAPWTDAKSEYYTAFVARTMALDRLAEAEPSTRARDLKLDPKEEAGPSNMKEILAKESVSVRVVAVQGAIENLVRGNTKKRLSDAVAKLTQAQSAGTKSNWSKAGALAGMVKKKSTAGKLLKRASTGAEKADRDYATAGAPAPAPALSAAPAAAPAPSPSKAFNEAFLMVSLDEAMDIIMGAWQDAADQVSAERRAHLDAMFEEVDENGDGTLEFGEFLELANHAQPGFPSDALLDMFDAAIQLSSEERHEEMDAVTREAFATIAAKFNLVSIGKFDFVDPHAPKKEEIFKIDPKLRMATVISSLHDGVAASQSLAQIGGQGDSQTPPNQPFRRQRTGKGSEQSQKHKSISVSGFEDHGVPKEEVLQPLENTQELEEQDRLLIQEGIRGNFLMRHLLNEENANMLKEMISHFAVRSVAAGEIVIKQGTKGDFFYVCESGRYDVIVDGVKVHTYEVDQAARSFPTFGELALMYSKPRAASIVATEAGRLFQLGRSSFKMALAAKAVAADVTKSLRKVGIFSSLRFDQLQGLRDLMIEKTFAPGETIISRGEYGSMFYIVVKGFARVMPEDGVAALTTLDNRLALQPVHSEVTLESSTYFGEHALFHGTAHTADVVAGDGIDGPLVTACLKREDFERLHGPLQFILDHEVHRRQALTKQHEKILSDHDLAEAGRGTFHFAYIVSTLACGELYLARHAVTNVAYTVRQEVKSRLKKANERSRVSRELTALKWVREAPTSCPELLPTLLCAFETNEASSLVNGSGSIYVVYQQRTVCDLATLAEAAPMSEAQVRFVGACVTQALDILHAEVNLVYRNLASDMLTVLEGGHVCLMDFRFSRRDDGSCRTLCGPVNTYAPEQLRGEAYGGAVDWWAMGTLLYELMTGESPWGPDGVSEELQFKRIMAHSAGTLFLPETSWAMGSFINSLLQPNIQERLGSQGEDGGGAQVKASPWFKKTEDGSEGIDWKRLTDGRLPSPLQATVAELQTAALREKPPEDLPEPLLDATPQPLRKSISKAQVDDWLDAD